MRCTSCGEEYIGPGACPKCASKSSIKKSDDEVIKKIVSDSDMYKGRFF